MCDICQGLLWVCENHPLAPWDDSMDLGCECGAGMPCVCNNAGAPPPTAKLIYGSDPSLKENDMGEN